MPKDTVTINLHIDVLKETLSLLDTYEIDTESMDPSSAVSIALTAFIASQHGVLNTLSTITTPLNEQEEQVYKEAKAQLDETLEYYTRGGPRIPESVPIHEAVQPPQHTSIDWTKLHKADWENLVREAPKDRFILEAQHTEDELYKEALCWAYGTLNITLWGTNAAHKLISMMYDQLKTDDG